MEYEWDDKKRLKNIACHKVDFAAVKKFNWHNAAVFEDVRFKYNECRMVAYGYITKRLVVLVYTMRGDVCRVISLRKANSREIRQYGER